MTEPRLNVHAIDVGYLGVRGAGAAFAVSHGAGTAPSVLVETGPAVCLPNLEAGLRSAGVAPSGIAHVLVTHVHLDHAGAAGHLAARGAHVWVHPRGARHLADPDRLIAGTRAVHGARFDTEYGTPLAIDPEHVHAVEDGDHVPAALGAQAMATPGHARHHHAWVLRDTDAAHVFVGDVAGILLPEGTPSTGGRPRRFLAVPMPPSDMDAAAWRESVVRLEALVDGEERAGRAVTLWLTHGGAASDARAHLRELRARHQPRAPQRHAERVLLIEPGAVPTAEAVERYAQWLWPRADAAGVQPADRAVFLGAAFMRMNLAGVAQEMERAAAS